LSKIKQRLEQLKDSKNKKVDLTYTKTFASDYMTQEEFQKTEFKKFKRAKNKRVSVTDSFDKEEVEKINNSITLSNKEKENYNEYDELDKALQTQRDSINQLKKKTQEQKLQEFIENGKKEDNIGEAPEGKETTGVVKGIIYLRLDKEYISETLEFLKNVPTKQEIEENYKILTTKTPVTLKDVKSGTASIVHMPLATERLRYGMSSVIKETSEPILSNHSNLPVSLLGRKREREDSITTVSLSEAEQELPENLPNLEEPPLGKGIAVALQIFRQRGMLGKETYQGRYKDKAPSNVSTGNKKEISLEYRDEKGRLMTQKETYRYMCHIFHGNKPSKRKQEKQLLRTQIEERNRNLDVSMNTRTFKYLKRQQETTNTPYVVLQGKNNINNI
jgi:U4/U6.U5 tri-snRNP-associated protein 1